MNVSGGDIDTNGPFYNITDRRKMVDIKYIENTLSVNKARDIIYNYNI